LVPNAPLPTTSSPPPIPKPPDSIARMAEMIIVFPLIVGGVLLAVAFSSRATSRDLGLPNSLRQFAQDVTLGVVASFAALIPVYGVLSVFELIFHQPAHHPIVDAVLREPNPVILILAAVSAVIVAPICEEIAFRLLLQGWLEKWEDEQKLTNDSSAELDTGECRLTNQDTVGVDASQVDTCHSSFAALGWLPIGASSLLFALAHAGQGSAPVALFGLSLILGFLYQRTHRIVPCIAMHATFNLLSIVGLLLRLVGPGE
jgi:membrane protease YdiL (CAAX protease family)